MTDGSGTAVWRAEAYAFGGLFSNTVTTVTNNLRFPGQYFDAETGLSQNWFRDYAPRIGRYQESDPIGLAGGTNTYAYANSKPTLITDFLGLCGAGGSSSPPVVGPIPPCTNDKKGRYKLGFINDHFAEAKQIASKLNTNPEFVLAQAANESTWGRDEVTVWASNYFGIHHGLPFTGGTGQIYARTPGDNYEIFDDPGFLNSGMSMANTPFGQATNGARTLGDYLRAFTTPQGPKGKIYNPTGNYVTNITPYYGDVMYWLPCLGQTP